MKAIFKLNCILAIIVFCLPLANNKAFSKTSEEITPPESFFGFTPGDDRKLISYSELVQYLEVLDSESSMLKMHHTGTTPMGRPMYITFISSADNIARLDELKDINKELALNSALGKEERNKMINDGRVFIMATLSMHSNEVGPSQAVPVMAYEFISSRLEEVKNYLNDVVLMLIPCHNPDGMDMMVDHYKKYLGTQYEGSTLPGVYHKYVGHNNNRDFVSLTQEDTRVVADIYNIEWYPQILVEKHEMGVSAVRYFVPPSHDPIAVNVDEGIWNWTWVFGSNMSKHMTSKGLAGVTQNYLFDDYWPGSTQTSSWKNIISMLTESASVRLATPVYVEKSEIGVWGKGLSEYKKSIKMPLPWEGGWWRLEDIVRYEIESIFSMVKTGSLFKEDILKYRNDLCIKEVNKGYNEAPYFYALPQSQHDAGELIDLLRLMKRHGVNVFQIKEDVVVQGRKYYAGDYIIPLAQPYRPFIKEVMEKQRFPVRRYTPGGEIIRPYDITSWSLPLHRGIESFEITQPQQWLYDKIEVITTDNLGAAEEIHENAYVVFSANHNESYKAVFKALSKGIKVHRILESIELNDKTFPKGSFFFERTNRNATDVNSIVLELNLMPELTGNNPLGKAAEVKMPRIALTETFFHDMDAGWTRFLFDNYGIPYTIIRPGEFKETNLQRNFDVIIFPDNSKEALMTGRLQRRGQTIIPFYHPDYTKGIEGDGWKEVIDFIETGGIVLSWARSTELFNGLMESKSGQAFNFPVNNVSSNLKTQGLSCPGSLLKLELNNDHPICYGMPESIGVFHRDNIILSTSIPIFDMDRRIIGHFPEEEEILLSGFAQNEELMENRPAVVWMSKGEGDIVLMSFAPNFRGSTPNAIKLIFNTLLLK